MMLPQIKFFVDRIDPRYVFTLVDIGAMGGVPQKWNLLRPGMKVIAFEPDRREFAKLQNSSNITYYNCALYKQSKDLKYYVTRGHGKSSFYPPDERIVSQFEDQQRFAIVKEEVLPCEQVKSLDCVLEENSIADMDFIKLDTQGSELPILEGGQKKVIPNIFGINVEIEFIQIYKDQPLFRDVDQFMDQNGFQLMDLRRAYWKRKDYYDYIGKGQLVFGDALYFKKIDTLIQELSKSDNHAYAVAKIYKSILICFIYRLFDYAVAVARASRELNLLSASDYQEALTTIKIYSKKNVLAHFPGKPWLYKITHRLSQILKPPSYLGWADGDHTIGNIKDT